MLNVDNDSWLARSQLETITTPPVSGQTDTMISGTSEHCPITSTATNCTYCPANNCPTSSGQLIARFEAPLLSIRLRFVGECLLFRIWHVIMSLYRAESRRNDFKPFTIGNGTYPLFHMVHSIYWIQFARKDCANLGAWHYF